MREKGRVMNLLGLLVSLLKKIDNLSLSFAT